MTVAKRGGSISFRVINNTAAFIGGEVFYRLVAFAAAVLVVRSLGVERYGQFSFIYVFISFFEVLVQFGFNAILTRWSSQGGEPLPRLLGNAILFRLLLALLSIPLSYYGIGLLEYPEAIRAGVLLASFQLILTVRAILDTVYRVNLMMVYPALWNALKALLTLSLVAVVAAFRGSLPHFILAYLASALAALAGYGIFTLRFTALDFRPDWRLLGRLVRESAPLMASGYLTVLYYRVDVFMLSKMKTFLEVGYYSVAVRVAEAMGLAATALMVSGFPLMSRFYRENRPDFDRLLTKSFKVLFLLGTAVALGGTLVAPAWIELVFGSGYAASGPTAVILLWYTCFFFIGTLLANLLIACDKQVVDMWISFALLMANIGLNLWFIPRWSYNGAALSTVLVEVCGVVMIFLYACRRTEIRLQFPVKELLLALKVNLPFFSFLFLLKKFLFLPDVGLTLLGCALYLPWLFLLGVVRWQDVTRYGAQWKEAA